MIELDKKNNDNEYEPKIYNRYEQNIRGYYDPGIYGQQEQRINGINIPKPNAQNKKKIYKNKGIIFLIWFIVWTIFAIFFSKIGLGNVSASICGEIFLISSAFVVFTTLNSSNKTKIFLSLFMIMGALLTMGGAVIKEGLTPFATRVAPIINPITALILTGIGLFILIANIVLSNKKSSVCTECVEAVVCELKVHRSSEGQKTYSPIYEYRYKGNVYTYNSNFYTNIGVKRVGTRINIYINPLNPYEIYIKSKAGFVIMNVVGIIVIAIGIFTIFNI